jgi:hypothetical protein
VSLRETPLGEPHDTPTHRGCEQNVNDVFTDVMAQEVILGHKK